MRVMRHFCFIGAGAVGGYYAALLARSGVRVTVIARGAHLGAIKSSGLRIESEAVGSFTFTITAPEVEEDTLFSERFVLMHDGVAAESLEAINLDVIVTGPSGDHGCGCGTGGGSGAGSLLLVLAVVVALKRRRRS